MEDTHHLRVPREAVRIEPMEYARLPESARRVFESVLDHGPLTHTDLRRLTRMPARTIRFAVQRLRREAYLDSRTSLRDARTCYFFVDARRINEEFIEEQREGTADSDTMHVTPRKPGSQSRHDL